jgi:hypothetical protein
MSSGWYVPKLLSQEEKNKLMKFIDKNQPVEVGKKPEWGVQEVQ